MVTAVVAILLNAAVGPSATRDLPPFPRGGLEIVNTAQAGGARTLTSTYWGSNYALFDFWAVWCQPCVAKIPELNEASAMLAQLNVKMIGMSIDETTSGAPNPDIVRNQLRRTPLQYPTAMVPREYRRAINAMITGNANAGHSMNVPMMILVRGDQVMGVLTGTQIANLHTAEDIVAQVRRAIGR